MFEFIENLKIREIIYRYRDFKKLNPDFTEDQLCRLVIANRLKDYPRLYNLLNNSDQEIKAYMDDLFKKELDLNYVCLWFMEQEYTKYSLIDNAHDLDGWRIRTKKLENRIARLIKKIPNI